MSLKRSFEKIYEYCSRIYNKVLKAKLNIFNSIHNSLYNTNSITLFFLEYIRKVFQEMRKCLVIFKLHTCSNICLINIKKVVYSMF